MSVPLEIERKFLLKDESWLEDNIVSVSQIIQCYLIINNTECERVRISESFGCTSATYTKKKHISDIVREEDESPISIIQAVGLLKGSKYPTITKTRYCIERDNVVWEIDMFFEDNLGLRVAEIELKSETQDIIFPKWLGEEVSTDFKYTNLQLTTRPFTSW